MQLHQGGHGKSNQLDSFKPLDDSGGSLSKMFESCHRAQIKICALEIQLVLVKVAACRQEANIAPVAACVLFILSSFGENVVSAILIEHFHAIKMQALQVSLF